MKQVWAVGLLLKNGEDYRLSMHVVPAVSKSEAIGVAFQDLPIDRGWLLESLATAEVLVVPEEVSKAVAEERERCANLAESFDAPRIPGADVGLGHHIAATIRSRICARPTSIEVTAL